jgi:molecular chaperone DnaJ
MAEKDYYQTLGVGRDASREEIKRAYKRLAKKYHPDLNKDPDAEKKFKEVNEAASVLADDEKRRQYDQFGSEGLRGFGAAGFDFSDFANFGGFDFDEIFDSFFGGGRRRRRFDNRGADLQASIEISLEEAAFGTTKTLSVSKLVTCDQCHGQGSTRQDAVRTCPKCNGNGIVRVSQRTMFGYFATTQRCNECRGEGKIVSDPCNKCGGDGRIKKSVKIEIKIPEGVEEGTRLRLAGEGEAGIRGGPSGDLYVVIRLASHKVFEREGPHLYLEVPISVSDAALGTKIEVPLLKGTKKINIPAGTQPETVFRLRGE